MHGAQSKFSTEDGKIIKQFARACNSNVAIAYVLNYFGKEKLKSLDAIIVTYSAVNRMKLHRMFSGTVFTEDVVKELTDNDLTRMAVGNDGQVVEISLVLTSLRNKYMTGRIFITIHFLCLSTDFTALN